MAANSSCGRNGFKKEEIEPLLKLRAENSDRISVCIKKLRQSGLEPGRETALFEEIENTRTVYVESYRKALRVLLGT
jgi:hypothetical protein